MIIMIANFPIMRVHKEGLSYLKVGALFILFEKSEIKSDHHFLALISWQEGWLTMTMRCLRHEKVEIGPRGGSLSVQRNNLLVIRRVRSGESLERVTPHKLKVILRTEKHENHIIYSPPFYRSSPDLVFMVPVL